MRSLGDDKKAQYEIAHVQNYVWIKKKDLIVYGCYSGSNRNYEKGCQRTFIGLVGTGNRETQAKWRNLQFECEKMDFFSHEYGNWVCAIMKKRVKKRVVGTIIQVGSLKKLDAPSISIADYNELNEEVDDVYFEGRTGRFALG